MATRNPADRPNRSRLNLHQLEDRITPDGTIIGPGAPTPPTANDDVADTDGNNPVQVAVLANDAAAAPAALDGASVRIVSGPSRGTVAVDVATGEVTYTATGFFLGTDSFRYTVKDSAGLTSNVATATVIINRPTANDDFAETSSGTAVPVDVLGNDTDPDGNDQIDPATVAVVSAAANGTTAVDPATGQITYTPAGGFVGTDTFRYTVTDKAGAVSAPGNVTVVVNPPTSPPPPATQPTASDDVADTDGNNPVAVAVLTNDLASTGQTLQPGTVTVTTNPTRGTVAVNPSTGEVTYTAAGFFLGTDSFRYTVKDTGGNTSAPATVTIVVNRPTANDDFADTDGNNPVPVNVLENDTDPDGNDKIDAGSVAIVSPPARGTVSVNPSTGEVTYTATGSFQGTDTFRYTITDAAGAVSSPGTVTIVVNRPTANDDFATAGANPITIFVLANDTDPDGNDKIDPASVRIVAPPAHGTVRVNPATGAVTYTPPAGYSGADSFTYTVADEPGAVSAPGTVRIQVSQPPVVVPGPTPIRVVGADAGGGPRVTVYNPDGSTQTSFFAFDPSFLGGVRVAVGDVNGDGTADVIAAAGPGGGPAVRVFDGKDFSLMRSFFAYSPSFSGGVFVAVGDVDGDGKADIITGTGITGGPQVNVFSGATGNLLSSFFAYDSALRSGVTVAVGDTNGDGKADIITGTGVGGAPNVRVFSGQGGALQNSFYAFAAQFSGGVFVAVGDVNGDGIPDIIAGAGPGGGPQVTTFSGKDGSVLNSFAAYDASVTTGVRVAAVDVNRDGRADLLVSVGPGSALPSKTFNAATLGELGSTDSFGEFTGGVFVA